MPFINVITNAELNKGRELKLKAALGEAITALPGKSEHWLMLAIQPSTVMYFQGKNDLCAMIQVSVFGNQTREAKNALTQRVTKAVFDELKVSPERIYVSYHETPDWGMNGSNF